MSNPSSKIFIIISLQSIIKAFTAKQFYKFKNLLTVNLKRKHERKTDFLFITNTDIVFHFMHRPSCVIEVRKVILCAVYFKFIPGKFLKRICQRRTSFQVDMEILSN